MTVNNDKRIKTGYVTAFLLLLLAYTLVFYSTHQMQLQTKLLMHANSVLIQIEILVSDVKDAETGMRGYIALKDKIFLEPYYSSKYLVPISINKLEKLIADNPVQTKYFDTIKFLIAEKFSIMNNAILAFNNAGLVLPDSIRKKAFRGKLVMDDIRRLALQIKNNENILLTERTMKLNAINTAIKIINVTSLALAFLLALYSVIIFNRESKAKNIYRVELEKKVDDLNTTNNELLQLKSIEKFAATGRIARTIAHEVRNPLTNIGLASEQLRELIAQNEEANLYLDMIKRNGDRINQLVSTLLQSTKFNELKATKESINTLLDEAVLMAEDRIQLHGLKVQRKYADDICDVSVDKEKIKIAFLNVIVNAIEAMEPGKGVLTLKTMAKNNKCMIKITDNGTGMDNESLSKIFEPYFTNKEKGNGLGLTNTQNIILSHKGNIQVESEFGKGTTFIITLDFAS